MSDPEIEKILSDKAKSIENSMKKFKIQEPINLTSENFDKIISSDKPVIVDFWADWCGPCKFMIPAFEKLAKKFNDKMIFTRLNVDENGDIASKYQIFSIPTFMIFKNGQPLDMKIGAVGEVELENFIQKYTI